MSGQAQSANPENHKENAQITKVQPAPKARPANRTLATSLGRWTLLKPLARGGMGEVYLATSGGIEGAERPAVVKIIRREHAQDKSFLARFFDEARIQAQLQHPGVAQVLEASTDQSGKPYVVLEHVEGRNLSEVRGRASQLNVQLSWADAVAVAIQLGEALAHVHERTDAAGKALDIVHRDLSPQNVMVGYAGDVKLIDFGTARGENRRCQTVSGIVFAKPGYVAPEVANQNQPGPQADLYALGVILWELVMGRRFLTGDPAEHLTKVASGTRNPPAVSLTNNVPLELDTVIARLTAPRLQDRYATAREAVSALARVLSRAPSLADGERSIRGRIAHLMSRLYPSEPTRTRAEFATLVSNHRSNQSNQPQAPEVRAQAVPESPKPDPADAKDMLPGTRYRLERELSKSALSVVYVAQHIDLGRRVALKVLPREHCDDPKFEAQFRHEARALAQLRNDALVTLHDFGVSQDGRPYYAMELLQGHSLRAQLENGTLEWRRALRIAIDVSRALEDAHASGIVHRDIKPENIFLTDSGETKLIDFGIAQAEQEPPVDQESGAVYMHGTPEYMAPEQLGHGQVDERADLYALATVIYEMLTGVLPHHAEGAMALLDAKQHHKVLPPSKAPTSRGIPGLLDSVLLKALSARPDQRYVTAALFAYALESCLKAPARGRRRRRQAAVVALASVVFGAGFLSYQNLDAQARATLTQLPAWMLDPSARPEATANAVAEAAPVMEVPEQSGAVAVDGRGAIEDGITTADRPEASDSDAELEEQAPDDSLVDNSASDSDSDSDSEGLDDPASANDESSDGSAATAADAPDSVELDEATRRQMAKADELIRSNRAARELALARYRKLGEKYPEHPEVLAGWSRAAAGAKWWGESLRVALRWASLDPRAEAQLHLARTQRLVGQRYGAIQTLERLLEKLPDNQEATAMLARYRER